MFLVEEKLKLKDFSPYEITKLGILIISHIGFRGGFTGKLMGYTSQP